MIEILAGATFMVFVGVLAWGIVELIVPDKDDDGD